MLNLVPSVLGLAGSFTLFAGALPNPSPATVRVAELPERKCVYVEHRGPYWRVGPVVAEAVSYRTQHRLTGDVFVRYLEDPILTPQERLRAQVGILLHGEHSPEPPFQAGVLPAETAAYTIMDVPSGTGAYVAILRGWADVNGFMLTGPVTELYPSTFSTTPAGKIAEKVELQAAIRRAEPKEVVRNRPSAERGVPPLPIDAPKAEPNPEARVSVLPAAPGAKSDGMDPADSPPEPASSRDSDAALPPIVRVEVPLPQRRDAAGFVRDRNYEGLADWLLPESQVDSTVQIWLGTWFARLGAAARGIEKSALRDSTSIGDVHKFLHGRFLKLFGPAKPDYRDQALVWTQMQQHPKGNQLRSILRDTDVLLSRIGSGSISAAALDDELCRILDSIHSVTSQGP